MKLERLEQLEELNIDLWVENIQDIAEQWKLAFTRSKNTAYNKTQREEFKRIADHLLKHLTNRRYSQDSQDSY